MNEAHRYLVVCLNSRSKISKIMEGNGDIHNLCVYEVPHGKDGFLAVNSTIGMLTVFQRIFHIINSIDKKISVGFSDELDVSESFLSKKTIIALSGEWTTPVADDFESKWGR